MIRLTEATFDRNPKRDGVVDLELGGNEPASLEFTNRFPPSSKHRSSSFSKGLLSRHQNKTSSFLALQHAKTGPIVAFSFKSSIACIIMAKQAIIAGKTTALYHERRSVLFGTHLSTFL
jgi:hypothetical protein